MFLQKVRLFWKLAKVGTCTFLDFDNIYISTVVYHNNNIITQLFICTKKIKYTEKIDSSTIDQLMKTQQFK